MKKFLLALVFSVVTFANEELMLDAANAYIMTQRSNKETSFNSLALRSKAIIVFPSVKKLGFVLGGMGGSGVMMIDPQGDGLNLKAVEIRAGSLGLQVGYKDSALVLFIMRDSVVADINDGKFTFDAEAIVAFGDISRGVNKIKDLDFSKDIYAFATNGGFFAGASFGGAMISATNERFKTSGYAYSQLLKAIGR